MIIALVTFSIEASVICSHVRSKIPQRYYAISRLSFSLGERDLSDVNGFED